MLFFQSFQVTHTTPLNLHSVGLVQIASILTFSPFHSVFEENRFQLTSYEKSRYKVRRTIPVAKHEANISRLASGGAVMVVERCFLVLKFGYNTAPPANPSENNKN